MNDDHPNLNPGLVTIRAIDTQDASALERHVTFEQAHGTPRYSVAELRAWLPSIDAALLLAAEDAGGSCVGTRSRIERPVTPNDAQFVGAAPDGLEIVALAGRPDLELDTLRVWNESPLDIPSPLPFSAVDRAGWCSELETIPPMRRCAPSISGSATSTSSAS